MVDMERGPAKGRGGRPRSFDRDAALEKALTLFWTQGYEATSVADLTAAMEIAPPSLYAAFGNKEKLFLESVARYGALYGTFTARALAEEKTARLAVERILTEAARLYTLPDQPPGCFVISGATNCSPASASVEEALRKMRIANEGRIRTRIEAAIADGELAHDTDAEALADYVGAIMQGMSQHARDGATRERLEAIAGLALLAWPAKKRRPTTPKRG